MPRSSHTRASRRQFLAQAAAAGISLPFFVRTLRSAPPSEAVRHASFGAAGMAAADHQAIAGHPSVKLRCVVDVDAERGEKVKDRFPDVIVYRDWRQMLDKEAKNLDSVNVGTPDHMHAPMAMSALQRGLAVYCQKPLTHDVFESRRLAEVAREKKLVSQMGIQVHSNNEYRMAVRLVQDGAIGLVKDVHTWSNKKWGDPTPRPETADTPPASLNWDLWLGVCAERPFIGGGYYHPGNWRKRLDFGTGTFGDMGCHIYDPVFKALALTAPLSVRSEGQKPNEYNWANNAVVHYVFPGTKFTAGKTVAVTWYDGDQRPPSDIVSQIGRAELPGQGSIFLGEKGIMVLPHVAMPILLPEEKFKDYARPTLEPVNHWHQFVEAVRGNGQTSANFDYAGPLTESILLGGVASRFPQTTLEWDAAKLRFTNVAEANQYLRRTYRQGWAVAGLSDV
ncbi:MAG: Gfo/Idh/MocA family oxidoreductase [Planctomycetaceae bacterium]|nr:Gfo/Idh/MocA family oxidoreductase [Planctomycetaceae bacterium]